MSYSESELIEQPAIQLFAELGWETLSASDEVMGASGTLGREFKSEVILVTRLRSVLERLNPALPIEAIASAVDELSRYLLLPRLLSGQIDLVAAEG